MSLVKEKVLGRLIQLNEDLSCLEYGKPEEFIQKLIELVAVEFPDTEQADLIVIGFQVPSEEDKGRPWFRTDTKGNFLGLHFFQDGSWKRVFNLRADMLVWTFGDSRKIPKGFELITSDTPGIEAGTLRHITDQYRRDPTITDAVVYTNYAIRWIGF